jgi:adenosylhomocysteinase
MTAVQSDIADKGLVDKGTDLIEWASDQMDVLAELRKRFRKTKPLDDVRIAGCLHITTETANLARTLKAAGADVRLCASNPLSTNDAVAAGLVEEYGIPVFAIHDEDKDTYYSHIHSVLDMEPHLTIDDGCDLVYTIHEEREELIDGIHAGMEETTTGLVRLRAMANEGSLRFPVFAVNDATTKHLFDNRHGTGQSSLEGIMRATNMLMAGSVVVVSGYGMCGRGFANRARGMGARVIVTETDPLRALEAHMDGFDVKPMAEAAPEGDLFATFTGNTSVVRREHFEEMKDGAILCNGGHFNVEIDLEDLEEMSNSVEEGVREHVDAYELDDKTLYVLGEGRLVNLSCADGHPASVMDMSFATQSLTCLHVIESGFDEEPDVYPVPEAIEKEVSSLKLSTLDVEIDELTDRQEEYLNQAGEGT